LDTLSIHSFVEPVSCDNVSKHYSVKETLRSYQFWMIFANVFLNIYVMSFVYSDWKVFAENYLHIQNDGFLLNLDIAAAIVNAIGRIVWGWFLDYTNSYRLTMTSAASMLCLLMITLPMCNDESMAFVWICALWFACAATYVIFPPTISNTFGDRYCAILVSFVMISEIAATSLQSSVFLLMQNVNVNEDTKWIILPIISACFSGVSLVISMNFGLPVEKIYNDSDKLAKV